MQNSKVRLITPFLMLFAGALASIIMYIKEYDFYTMLWVLLVVLVVFYIIGDVVRYLYTLSLPRVLPQGEIEEMIEMMNNGVVAKETEETETGAEEDSESLEEESSEYDMEEDSIDDESVEEYTDENLDEM